MITNKIFNSFIARGRSLDNSSWIYGYYVNCNNEHYIIPSSTINFLEIDRENILLKAQRVLPHTVSYYTFEKDINDTMIYEGDILKTVVSPDTLFSTEQLCVVISLDGDVYGDGFLELEKDDFKWCEVVGNTHENPDIYEQLKEEIRYIIPKKFSEQVND